MPDGGYLSSFGFDLTQVKRRADELGIDHLLVNPVPSIRQAYARLLAAEQVHQFRQEEGVTVAMIAQAIAPWCGVPNRILSWHDLEKHLAVSLLISAELAIGHNLVTSGRPTRRAA